MNKNEVPVLREIYQAFEGTNFGDNPDCWNILRHGLLKVSCGYHNGMALQRIMESMGLKFKDKQGLTSRGQLALWAWFKQE
jgi:hypothetical protein